MSYDLYLTYADTSAPIEVDNQHFIAGGIHEPFGTNQCWLNISYNYSGMLRRVLGYGGIDRLDGLTGRESIPILTSAIEELSDDFDSNYWLPTEGNVKIVLASLAALAELRPDGVWRVYR